MKDFTALYFDIDSSTKTSEKLSAIKRYFSSATDRDAAWALFFLIGKTLPRAVNTRLLRTWISEASNLPLWLVEESYDAVGDLAETMALLFPDRGVAGLNRSLAEIVESQIVPLRTLDDSQKRDVLLSMWSELDYGQRLVWNKLITGSMRIGVSRTLVERALSDLAGTTQATMAHRLMGDWESTPEHYRMVMSGNETSPIGQPYPFMLAYPVDVELETLGAVDDWIAEWKWDGIRAQIIRRRGEVLIWSRGEERIVDSMPEIAEVGAALPDGTVIDGEILAWENGLPLPFNVLQRRLNRKSASSKLLREAPTALVAYDILEYDSSDIRGWELSRRRELLQTVITQARNLTSSIYLSPVVEKNSWDELRRERSRAGEMHAEGLMLKRKDSKYGTGRQRGAWWKWKIEPYSVDAVMVYAQAGHGRRASLFTDYTFAVWDNGELLPIAKAYSGLTDQEINEVDRFVRSHTLEKHGPVRVVQPSLVFEIAFEGIQLSSRHKSGVAVRFPRIARMRPDKSASEADTLDQVKALLKAPARE